MLFKGYNTHFLIKKRVSTLYLIINLKLSDIKLYKHK